MVSADGMLNLYTDWHDITSWPGPSTGEPQRKGRRMEDPTTKAGVVPSIIDHSAAGCTSSCEGEPSRRPRLLVNSGKEGLPSFTAMTQLAASDPQVSGLIMDERYEKAQSAFGVGTCSREP